MGERAGSQVMQRTVSDPRRRLSGTIWDCSSRGFSFVGQWPYPDRDGRGTTSGSGGGDGGGAAEEGAAAFESFGRRRRAQDHRGAAAGCSESAEDARDLCGAGRAGELVGVESVGHHALRAMGQVERRSCSSHRRREGGHRAHARRGETGGGGSGDSGTTGDQRR